ncbi:MAG: hypothetical protein AB3N22_05110 [Ruegeria sp.]
MAINNPAFYEHRRNIRTELFTLQAEREIIPKQRDAKVLVLMRELDTMLRSPEFAPPKAGDYDDIRLRQISKLRAIQASFVGEMQNLVDVHWLQASKDAGE